MSPEFSVVVPVCNEAENVEPLAREIAAAMAGRSCEMIFIDDGSTDETATILLSQMSQRPILPMAYAASRATLFQWDKFVLPWPFSRIVIAIGAPRQVPRTLKPEALEILQKEMAVEMKALFAVARDALSTKAVA